jgi:DNA-binding SARP family transcriptional activator
MTAALLERLRRVPAEPLRVVTLGRFEVWRGMRRIDPSALRRRRADELLALLLLNSSHTLTFDQIAEALWSDKEPDAARIAFHHATSALRHALEPDLPDKFPSRYLKIEEGRVSLVLPPASFVDFEAFEAHCRHGEWSAALKLYAGDLFLDYLYEDWAIMPRQQLSLRYQQALRAVAEEHLKSSRFREALDTCLRLLALEPWHEQAVLLGMRACLALHDRAGALRLYHNLEQALRTELGITPCEELQALYRSLAAE